MVTDQDRVGPWVLNPEHSKVAFTHKSMWGLVNVRGTFGGVSGEVTQGADASLQGSISVDATTIDTKNRKRDTHLKSADFFDAEAHPTISYAVRSGEFLPDGTVVLNGELQVHGVTRPVELTARIDQESASSATLSAEVIIDRADFGLAWNRMGMINGKAALSVEAQFSREAA
jgi:polyisoprenoid-binding protein YceI